MKRRKSGLFLKIAVLAFAAYSAYTLLTLQFEINERKQQVLQLQEQIEQQRQSNEQLAEVVENGDSSEYMEKIARDKLGLALPDERVFINPDAK